MYFAARLAALIIYVLVLFVVCISISNTKNRKKAAALLTVYVVILSGMGYFFVPHSGADLSRILVIMHTYAKQDVFGIIESMLRATTPGSVLYYWIIGKFGNDHLLPAISGFITFSVCFSILRSLLIREDGRIAPTDVAVALFLFMSRGLLMQSISNIRTPMSLALAAWCIYQEFYNGKKLKSLILPYTLSASLHLLGVVVLFYRVGYSLIERGGSRIKRINRWVCAMGFGVCAIIVGWKYVAATVQKARNYIVAAVTGTGYEYFWEKALCVITWLVLCYVVYFFCRVYRYTQKNGLADETSHKTKKLIEYLAPLMGVDIVIMFIEFSTFQRLNWYLSMLLLPLVACTLREARLAGEAHVKVFHTNLLIASASTLFLACARGDLCSLKFFGG